MGISTHVLDTSSGRPAVGVAVALARGAGDAGWKLIHRAVTDDEGRCRFLLPLEELLEPGVYAIRFETAAYYAAQGVAGLYPYIEITFTARAGQAHYHVPLLLTANGYTTYRGT